jgi:hypothetical protein
MKQLLSSLVLSGVVSLSWAQTYLSPNQIGGGNVPGTYANVVFSVYDGNWTPQIRLPAVADDKAQIKLVSDAGYGTQVLQAHTDIPLPALSLSRGQTLQYQYSSSQKRWEIVGPTVWAPNNGSTMNMATTTHRVMRARMGDGAWAPAINLPASAVDEAILLVSSSATWNSRIDPSHVMHASTMPLRNTDEYTFVFNQRLGKWVLRQSPETTLTLRNLQQGQLPTPTAALTRLNLPAGTAATNLRLPTRAGDRDRVLITSNSDARTTIANNNVQGVGNMSIGKGQTYEFMWNAAANTWAIMHAPRTQIALQSLQSGVLSSLNTPVTEVLAWDGNWRSSFALPRQALSGDRVTVKSSATWSFAVEDGGTAGFGRHTITTGDDVTFVRVGTAWQRETDTIRILLTYSQGVTTQLGSKAARARQIESLRLTNESLENSGATFRFQIANLMEVPTLGNDMGTSLRTSLTHAQIQNERNRVKADAVYYEGVEGPYCGLAYVNVNPSAHTMSAVGGTGCGTTVMRHELGHNMGLPHGDGVVPTVMSGNGVPFFATPKRFDPTLRVHMGHGAQRPDEVTFMNNNASSVSRFR